MPQAPTLSADEHACPECGADVGGAEGCNQLMLDLNARGFGDARYFIVHRLAVDAYALQHPKEYCRSAKSMAAHLVGMCIGVEHEGNLMKYGALQRWLNGAKELERPDPPAFRGELTIDGALDVGDIDEYIAAVREWARCVWDAWQEHHDLARAWVDSLDI